MGSLRNDTRPQKKALWAGAGDSAFGGNAPGVVSIEPLSWAERQALSSHGAVCRRTRLNRALEGNQ